MEINNKNKDVKAGLEVVSYLNTNWKNIKDPTDEAPRGWFEIIDKKEIKKHTDLKDVYAVIKIYMKGGNISEFYLNKEAYKWFLFYKKMRLGL